MQLRSDNRSWGLVTQLLHWLIFLLILGQVVGAYYVKGLPVGMEKFVWLSRHKSVGMLILLLMIIRLIWRGLNRTPTLEGRASRLEAVVAAAHHWLLIVAVFAMIMSGWLASSAANLAPSFFGLFAFPPLIEPNKEEVDGLIALHRYVSWLLGGLVALHVAAALKHHFVHKNDVLKRMLPWSSLARGGDGRSSSGSDTQ